MYVYMQLAVIVTLMLVAYLLSKDFTDICINRGCKPKIENITKFSAF